MAIEFEKSFAQTCSPVIEMVPSRSLEWRGPSQRLLAGSSAWNRRSYRRIWSSVSQTDCELARLEPAAYLLTGSAVVETPRAFLEVMPSGA